MTSIYRAVKRSVKGRGPRTQDRDWNHMLWRISKSKTFTFEATYTRMQILRAKAEPQLSTLLKQIREEKANGKSKI